MPSTYAHRRFGADVLALLPDGLRATLEQHRELYDIGLHGPDLMFYYKALQSNPVNRLGNLFIWKEMRNTTHVSKI